MALTHNPSHIWFNGELITCDTPHISCLNYALHYGFGVLEGLRLYDTIHGPAIFRLHDHTDRLLRSAEILNLPVCYSKSVLNNAQKMVVKHNNLRSAYIRPMAFLDAENPQLHTKKPLPCLMVAAWAWQDSYLDNSSAKKGIKVHIASFNPHNHNHPKLAQAKATGHYMYSILAMQEAKAKGYDEALFLDHHGFVAQGSGANIFIISQGQLYTPKLTSALAGITRATLCTLAEEMGLSVNIENICRDRLYQADEIFLCGTAAEIIPIYQVDDKLIGKGCPGLITKVLHQLYHDQVRGERSSHQEWLTFI